MPVAARPRWRFGWWGQLFGLVAVMVGSGHLLVSMKNLIIGEAQPRGFSLSGFALLWVLMAAGASLLQWWEHRSRDRRPKSARPRWRDDAPRWLVVASAVANVCALVTWLAGYTAALDGELNLLWADALTAAVYAVAALFRRLGERHGMSPESEAVGGL